ncbi:MAG: GGDEF domain-containing protein [Clostridiales bacterium]|nr:GGDEF domain-containing protein [Clostridiales bacterium]
MNKKLYKPFDAIQSLDTWEFMWQVAKYMYFFVLVFTIISGFLIYFAVSIGMGFAPFSSWGELRDFHIKFVISLALGLFLFSLLLTILLVEIYEKIIYVPVKALLTDLENKAKARDQIDNDNSYLRMDENKFFVSSGQEQYWTDKIRDAMQKVTNVSFIDALTGCFNKNYFSSSLTDILKTRVMCSITDKKHPKTNDSVCVALYLIDIDFFKTINDEYGHLYGDEVLKQVGNVLKKCVGVNGLVIRIGGEEFLLAVLHQFPVDYSEYAEAIRAEFSNSVRVPANSTHPERSVTCSIGFTPYPLFEEWGTMISVQEHVDMADQAMYLAKGGGRNTWRGIEPIREPENQNEVELALSSIEYGLKMGYYRVIKPDEKKLFEGVCRPGNYYVKRDG